MCLRLGTCIKSLPFNSGLYRNAVMAGRCKQLNVFETPTSNIEQAVVAGRAGRSARTPTRSRPNHTGSSWPWMRTEPSSTHC
jgi:hypothetical protein